MNTETTDTTQQPNPADAGSNGAANPNEGAVTAPASTEGQGADNAAATDEGKTADGQDKSATEGEPITYEAFTLPEGFTLEGERLEQAQGFFKELKLDQAGAQKAVDLFCELSGKDAASLSEVVTKGIEDARAQQVVTWGTESVKEFGANYDTMVENARHAVSVLLPDRPNLQKAFDDQGWGNHPDLIYAFHKMGSLLREGGMDTGHNTGRSTQPQDLAGRMYPNMR